MVRRKKQMLGWMALIALLMISSVAQAQRVDQPLTDDQYYILDGLDGRDSYCGDLGQIGVSRYASIDKKLFMAGSIQASFDNGRTGECARDEQVYNLVNRSQAALPGLTNTLIGIGVPSVCATEPVCRWSTMYAGPHITTDTSLEEMTQAQKNSVGVVFPDQIDGRMIWQAIGRSSDMVQSRFYVLPDDDVKEDTDIIFVTQYVYKSDGKPYFDVTWKINTLLKTYDDVDFYHAVDTYTSGNDFGYGYLCDVCKISGGTGGSAFFQGSIALHPSERQYEGWWGAVLERVKDDSLPEYDWSRPMSINSVTGNFEIPLTQLDDNAVAQQWSDLEISPTPTYVSARWTFDDPILQSTYGSPRSLFEISSDDVGYYDTNLTGPPASGSYTLNESKPMLFDVIYYPRHWPGKILAKPIPQSCTNEVDCENADGYNDKCLPAYECKNAPSGDCPKYCAAGYCENSCAASESCVFGFCMEGGRWEVGDMPSTVSSRKIFTFDKSGKRIWLRNSDAAATTLMGQLGFTDVADKANAKNILAWVTGDLHAGNDADGVIIDDNESHDYDLHDPKVDVSGTMLNMLRRRYSYDPEAMADKETSDNIDPVDKVTAEQWLLGDVSHAEPVYIGMRPMNSWSDEPDDTDPPIAAMKYSEYVESQDYQYRQPVLLVAANDGMLHAYDATTGHELWAFIPWDVLPMLRELSKPMYEQLRTPSMDLTPVVHDAYDANVENKWRTVLMVGSRGGGDHYWAMDISPPNGHLLKLANNSSISGLSDEDKGDQTRVSFLWYFTDPDLGKTYSVPTSGRFIDSTHGSRWLAFVGSGYAQHSADQMRKQGYFYAFEMFPDSSDVTPEVIAKKAISRTEISGMGADEVDPYDPVDSDLKNVVLSSGTVADSNMDGLEDVVYIGDSVGHLLRFSVDLSQAGDDRVHGQVLFNTFKGCDGASGSEDDLDEYLSKVENLRQAAGGDQTYQFFKYPRPITTRPVVWRTRAEDESVRNVLGDAGNSHKLMVFVGTGKYDAFYDSFDEYKRDPNDSDCQSWPYNSGCVRDYQAMIAVVDHQGKGDSARLTWCDIYSHTVKDYSMGTDADGNPLLVREVDMDTSYSDDPDPESGTGSSGVKGWSISFNSTLFDNRGEKVITEPVIWEQQQAGSSDSGWIAFFTTFTPNMQGTCDIRTVNDAGGGYLMTVDAETGGNPSFPIQDVNADSLIDGTDTLASGEGLAGHKFTGSILSRVDVDPYQGVVYVKTGPDNPTVRVQINKTPSLQGANTLFYWMD